MTTTINQDNNMPPPSHNEIQREIYQRTNEKIVDTTDNTTQPPQPPYDVQTHNTTSSLFSPRQNSSQKQNQGLRTILFPKCSLFPQKASWFAVCRQRTHNKGSQNGSGGIRTSNPDYEGGQHKKYCLRFFMAEVV